MTSLLAMTWQYHAESDIQNRLRDLEAYFFVSDLLVLLSDHEDGGRIFLRNVCELPDYTV
jgi:hypothetical protein